jgi:hypothetical protein
LGLLALLFGVSLLEAFGRRLESISGLLLIGFGLVYALWGLRRVAHAGLHGQGHHHHRMTAWSLFALFSLDPCIAVIPLLLADAPLGTTRTLAIVLAYEVAMLATMMALALPARAAVNAVRGPRWIATYADAAAGAAIVAVGVIVGLAGW